MNFMNAARANDPSINGIIGEARSLAASLEARDPFAIIVFKVADHTLEALEAWANGAGLTVAHVRGLTAYRGEAVEFMPKDSDSMSVRALVFGPVAA